MPPLPLEPPLPLDVPEEVPLLVPEPEPWVPEEDPPEVLGALTLPLPVSDPVVPADPDDTDGLPEDWPVDVGGGALAWVTGALTAAVVVTWTAACRCGAICGLGCRVTFGSSSAGAAGI